MRDYPYGKRLSLRLAAFVTLLCFGSETATAFPGNPVLKKPAPARTVYLILNAHGSSESQRQIARLLRFFQEKGIASVGLEGASDPVDGRLFRKFPDKIALAEAAWEMVKSGKLTGAEYFYITTQKLPRFYGLEEKEFYLENRTAFIQTMEAAKKVRPVLEKASRSLEKTKQKTLSAKLVRFLVLDERLRTKAVRFEEYFPLLAQAARETGISLVDFPNLYLLSKALSESKGEISVPLTKGIDKGLFGRELEAVTEQIYGRLAQSAKEREALERIRIFGRFKSLVDLELTRKEWGQINTGRWKKALRSVGLSGREIEALESVGNHALRFYALARRRDQVFVNKILTEFSERKIKSSVAVLGGFHEAGVREELEGQDITVIPVLPKLSEVVNDIPYRERLASTLDLPQAISDIVSWEEKQRLALELSRLAESFSHSRQKPFKEGTGRLRSETRRLDRNGISYSLDLNRPLLLDQLKRYDKRRLSELVGLLENTVQARKTPVSVRPWRAGIMAWGISFLGTALVSWHFWNPFFLLGDELVFFLLFPYLADKQRRSGETRLVKNLRSQIESSGPFLGFSTRVRIRTLRVLWNYLEDEDIRVRSVAARILEKVGDGVPALRNQLDDVKRVLPTNWFDPKEADHIVVYGARPGLEGYVTPRSEVRGNWKPSLRGLDIDGVDGKDEAISDPEIASSSRRKEAGLLATPSINYLKDRGSPFGAMTSRAEVHPTASPSSADLSLRYGRPRAEARSEEFKMMRPADLGIHFDEREWKPEEVPIREKIISYLGDLRLNEKLKEKMGVFEIWFHREGEAIRFVFRVHNLQKAVREIEMTTGAVVRPDDVKGALAWVLGELKTAINRGTTTQRAVADLKAVKKARPKTVALVLGLIVLSGVGGLIYLAPRVTRGVNRSLLLSEGVLESSLKAMIDSVTPEPGDLKFEEIEIKINESPLFPGAIGVTKEGKGVPEFSPALVRAFAKRFDSEKKGFKDWESELLFQATLAGLAVPVSQFNSNQGLNGETEKRREDFEAGRVGGSENRMALAKDYAAAFVHYRYYIGFEAMFDFLRRHHMDATVIGKEAATLPHLALWGKYFELAGSSMDRLDERLLKVLIVEELLSRLPASDLFRQALDLILEKQEFPSRRARRDAEGNWLLYQKMDPDLLKFLKEDDHKLIPRPLSRSEVRDFIGGKKWGRDVELQKKVAEVLERAKAKGGDHYLDIREKPEEVNQLIDEPIQILMGVDPGYYQVKMPQGGVWSPFIDQVTLEALAETLRKARVVLVKDPDNPMAPFLVTQGWRKVVVSAVSSEPGDAPGTIYLPFNFVNRLELQGRSQAIAALVFDAALRLFVSQHLDGKKLRLEQVARNLESILGISDPVTLQSFLENEIFYALRDYFRWLRRDQIRAALVIVHTHREYDPGHVAKPGIERLLDSPFVTTVAENHLGASYLEHAGLKYTDVSQWEALNPIQAQERHYILTGGNCTDCLFAEFKTLVEILAERKGSWTIHLPLSDGTYEAWDVRPFRPEHYQEYVNYLQEWFGPPVGKSNDSQKATFRFQKGKTEISFTVWNGVEPLQAYFLSPRSETRAEKPSVFSLQPSAGTEKPPAESGKRIADGLAQRAEVRTEAPVALIGTVLKGREKSYRILSPLEPGGQSRTFNGVEVKTNVPVVVKAVLPYWEGEAGSATRFMQLEHEIKILEILRASNHPNAPGIRDYEMNRKSRTGWIAMDDAEGVDLKVYANTHSLPQVISVFQKVLDAVTRLHKLGIVHRDLKPLNVKVTPEGEVTLLDYGLAHVLGNVEWEVDLIGSLSHVSTPDYRAPEPITPETLKFLVQRDIYALGVILYELATGYPALLNPLKTFREIYQETEKMPTKAKIKKQLLDPWKPFAGVIAKAIAADPKDRYSSVRGMIRAIAQASSRSEVRTPTLEWYGGENHPFPVDLKFDDAGYNLNERALLERALGGPTKHSIPSFAEQRGVPVPTLSFDWALKLGLDSLFRPRRDEQWSYENLTGALSQALKRPVSVDEVKHLEFWPVKEGGAMAVNRVRIDVKGGSDPVFLVVDVPKDFGPSNERVAGEFSLLEKWHERLPDRVMQPYELVQLVLRDRAKSAEPLPLNILIGKWFEGYLETHIVPSREGFFIQVIRSWGYSNGRGRDAILLNRKASDDFWFELARMKTVLTDFNGQSVTSGLFAINDGPFVAAVDDQNRLVRDSEGRPDIKMVSTTQTVGYPVELFPLILVTDSVMYHPDPAMPAQGRILFWNQPEQAFEAFIQGYIDQGTVGLTGEGKETVIQQRRKEALEILKRTARLRLLPNGNVRLEDERSAVFDQPYISGGDVFSPIVEQALQLLPSLIERYQRSLDAASESAGLGPEAPVRSEMRMSKSGASQSLRPMTGARAEMRIFRHPEAAVGRRRISVPGILQKRGQSPNEGNEGTVPFSDARAEVRQAGWPGTPQSSGRLGPKAEVRGATWIVRDAGQAERALVYMTPRAPAEDPNLESKEDLDRAWGDFHEMAFEFLRILDHAEEKGLPVALVVPEELEGYGPLHDKAPWIEGARVAMAWASAYFRFPDKDGRKVDIRILKAGKADEALELESIRERVLGLLEQKFDDSQKSPEEQMERRQVIRTANETVIPSPRRADLSLPYGEGKGGSATKESPQGLKDDEVFEQLKLEEFEIPSEEKREPVVIRPPPLELPPGKKRIVVTGVAGFLGSNLARRLVEEGHQVIGLDNLASGVKNNLKDLQGKPNFFFKRVDVSQPYTVEGDLDEIVHFASLASPPFYYGMPRETLVAGLQATKLALDLAREKKARFLFSSTSEVYGDPDVESQDEDYPGRVNPTGKRSQYDESKRGAETLIRLYFEREKAEGRHLDVRIVRIFNTYGPGMRLDDGRVITNFIQAALEQFWRSVYGEGKGRVIELYGGGGQNRSFGYVDDTIEGIVRLLETEKITRSTPIEGRVANIGNPGNFTIRELAGLVQGLSRKYLGIEVPVTDVPQIDSTDPKQRQPVIDRARRLLGYEPRVKLEEGLEKTFRHFIVKSLLPKLMDRKINQYGEGDLVVLRKILGALEGRPSEKELLGDIFKLMAKVYDAMAHRENRRSRQREGYQKALEAVEAALVSDPGNRGLWNDQAMFLIRLGGEENFSRAEEILHRPGMSGRQDFAARSYFHLSRARELIKRKDYDGARRELDRARRQARAILEDSGPSPNQKDFQVGRAHAQLASIEILTSELQRNSVDQLTSAVAALSHALESLRFNPRHDTLAHSNTRIFAEALMSVVAAFLSAREEAPVRGEIVAYSVSVFKLKQILEKVRDPSAGFSLKAGHLEVIDKLLAEIGRTPVMETLGRVASAFEESWLSRRVVEPSFQRLRRFSNRLAETWPLPEDPLRLFKIPSAFLRTLFPLTLNPLPQSGRGKGEGVKTRHELVKHLTSGDSVDPGAESHTEMVFKEVRAALSSEEMEAVLRPGHHGLNPPDFTKTGNLVETLMGIHGLDGRGMSWQTLRTQVIDRLRSSRAEVRQAAPPSRRAGLNPPYGVERFTNQLSSADLTSTSRRADLSLPYDEGSGRVQRAEVRSAPPDAQSVGLQRTGDKGARSDLLLFRSIAGRLDLPEQTTVEMEEMLASAPSSLLGRAERPGFISEKDFRKGFRFLLGLIRLWTHPGFSVALRGALKEFGGPGLLAWEKNGGMLTSLSAPLQHFGGPLKQMDHVHLNQAASYLEEILAFHELRKLGYEVLEVAGPGISAAEGVRGDFTVGLRSREGRWTTSLVEVKYYPERQLVKKGRKKRLLNPRYFFGFSNFHGSGGVLERGQVAAYVSELQRSAEGRRQVWFNLEKLPSPSKVFYVVSNEIVNGQPLEEVQRVFYEELKWAGVEEPEKYFGLLLLEIPSPFSQEDPPIESQRWEEAKVLQKRLSGLYDDLDFQEFCRRLLKKQASPLRRSEVRKEVRHPESAKGGRRISGSGFSQKRGQSPNEGTVPFSVPAGVYGLSTVDSSPRAEVRQKPASFRPELKDGEDFLEDLFQEVRALESELDRRWQELSKLEEEWLAKFITFLPITVFFFVGAIFVATFVPTWVAALIAIPLAGFLVNRISRFLTGTFQSVRRSNELFGEVQRVLNTRADQIQRRFYRWFERMGSANLGGLPLSDSFRDEGPSLTQLLGLSFAGLGRHDPPLAKGMGRDIQGLLEGGEEFDRYARKARVLSDRGHLKALEEVYFNFWGFLLYLGRLIEVRAGNSVDSESEEVESLKSGLAKSLASLKQSLNPPGPELTLSDMLLDWRTPETRSEMRKPAGGVEKPYFFLSREKRYWEIEGHKKTKQSPPPDSSRHKPEVKELFQKAAVAVYDRDPKTLKFLLAELKEKYGVIGRLVSLSEKEALSDYGREFFENTRDIQVVTNGEPQTAWLQVQTDLGQNPARYPAHVAQLFEDVVREQASDGLALVFAFSVEAEDGTSRVPATAFHFVTLPKTNNPDEAKKWAPGWWVHGTSSNTPTTVWALISQPHHFETEAFQYVDGGRVKTMPFSLELSENDHDFYFTHSDIASGLHGSLILVPAPGRGWSVVKIGDTKTIGQEVEWIESLPPGIRPFFPEIYDKQFDFDPNQAPGKSSYQMEWVSAANVEQDLLNEKISPEGAVRYWLKAYHLFLAARANWQPGAPDGWVKENGIEKVRKGLKALGEGFGKQFAPLMKAAEIEIDGATYFNMGPVLDQLETLMQMDEERMLGPPELMLQHLDLHLGNILPWRKEGVMIDPRGSPPSADTSYDPTKGSHKVDLEFILQKILIPRPKSKSSSKKPSYEFVLQKEGAASYQPYVEFLNELDPVFDRLEEQFKKQGDPHWKLRFFHYLATVFAGAVGLFVNKEKSPQDRFGLARYLFGVIYLNRFAKLYAEQVRDHLAKEGKEIPSELMQILRDLGPIEGFRLDQPVSGQFISRQKVARAEIRGSSFQSLRDSVPNEVEAIPGLEIASAAEKPGGLAMTKRAEVRREDGKLFQQVSQFFDGNPRPSQDRPQGSRFDRFRAVDGNDRSATQINLVSQDSVAARLSHQDEPRFLKGPNEAAARDLREKGHQEETARSLIKTWGVVSRFLSSSMDQRYNLIAFLILAIASAIVFPWEAQPGSVGTYTLYPPSGSSSITILYLTFLSLFLYSFLFLTQLITAPIYNTVPRPSQTRQGMATFRDDKRGSFRSEARHPEVSRSEVRNEQESDKQVPKLEERKIDGKTVLVVSGIHGDPRLREIFNREVKRRVTDARKWLFLVEGARATSYPEILEFLRFARSKGIPVQNPIVDQFLSPFAVRRILRERPDLEKADLGAFVSMASVGIEEHMGLLKKGHPGHSTDERLAAAARRYALVYEINPESILAKVKAAGRAVAQDPNAYQQQVVAIRNLANRICNFANYQVLRYWLRKYPDRDMVFLYIGGGHRDVLGPLDIPENERLSDEQIETILREQEEALSRQRPSLPQLQHEIHLPEPSPMEIREFHQTYEFRQLGPETVLRPAAGFVGYPSHSGELQIVYRALNRVLSDFEKFLPSRTNQQPTIWPRFSDFELVDQLIQTKGEDFDLALAVYNRLSGKEREFFSNLLLETLGLDQATPFLSWIKTGSMPTLDKFTATELGKLIYGNAYFSRFVIFYKQIDVRQFFKFWISDRVKRSLKASGVSGKWIPASLLEKFLLIYPFRPEPASPVWIDTEEGKGYVQTLRTIDPTTQFTTLKGNLWPRDLIAYLTGDHTLALVSKVRQKRTDLADFLLGRNGEVGTTDFLGQGGGVIPGVSTDGKRFVLVSIQEKEANWRVLAWLLKQHGVRLYAVPPGHLTEDFEGTRYWGESRHIDTSINVVEGKFTRDGRAKLLIDPLYYAGVRDEPEFRRLLREQSFQEGDVVVIPEEEAPLNLANFLIMRDPRGEEVLLFNPGGIETLRQLDLKEGIVREFPLPLFELIHARGCQRCAVQYFSEGQFKASPPPTYTFKKGTFREGANKLSITLRLLMSQDPELGALMRRFFRYEIEQIVFTGLPRMTEPLILDRGLPMQTTIGLPKDLSSDPTVMKPVLLEAFRGIEKRLRELWGDLAKEEKTETGFAGPGVKEVLDRLIQAQVEFVKRETGEGGISAREENLRRWIEEVRLVLAKDVLGHAEKFDILQLQATLTGLFKVMGAVENTFFARFHRHGEWVSLWNLLRGLIERGDKAKFFKDLAAHFIRYPSRSEVRKDEIDGRTVRWRAKQGERIKIDRGNLVEVRALSESGAVVHFEAEDMMIRYSSEGVEDTAEDFWGYKKTWALAVGDVVRIKKKSKPMGRAVIRLDQVDLENQTVSLSISVDAETAVYREKVEGRITQDPTSLITEKLSELARIRARRFPADRLKLQGRMIEDLEWITRGQVDLVPAVAPFLEERWPRVVRRTALELLMRIGPAGISRLGRENRGIESGVIPFLKSDNDAVRYFSGEILAHLRRRVPRPIEVLEDATPPGGFIHGFTIRFDPKQATLSTNVQPEYPYGRSGAKVFPRKLMPMEEHLAGWRKEHPDLKPMLVVSYGNLKKRSPYASWKKSGAQLRRLPDKPLREEGYPSVVVRRDGRITVENLVFKQRESQAFSVNVQEDGQLREITGEVEGTISGIPLLRDGRVVSLAEQIKFLNGDPGEDAATSLREAPYGHIAAGMTEKGKVIVRVLGGGRRNLSQEGFAFEDFAKALLAEGVRDAVWLEGDGDVSLYDAHNGGKFLVKPQASHAPNGLSAVIILAVPRSEARRPEEGEVQSDGTTMAGMAALEKAYGDLYSVLRKEFPELTVELATFGQFAPTHQSHAAPLISFLKKESEKVTGPFRILDFGGGDARMAYRLTFVSPKAEVTSVEFNPFFAVLARAIQRGASSEALRDFEQAYLELGRRGILKWESPLSEAEMRDKIYWRMGPQIQKVHETLKKLGILNRVRLIGGDGLKIPFRGYEAVYVNFPTKQDDLSAYLARQLLEKFRSELEANHRVIFLVHVIRAVLWLRAALKSNGFIEEPVDDTDSDFWILRKSGAPTHSERNLLPNGVAGLLASRAEARLPREPVGTEIRPIKITLKVSESLGAVRDQLDSLSEGDGIIPFNLSYVKEFTMGVKSGAYLIHWDQTGAWEKEDGHDSDYNTVRALLFVLGFEDRDFEISLGEENGKVDEERQGRARRSPEDSMSFEPLYDGMTVRLVKSRRKTLPKSEIVLLRKQANATWASIFDGVVPKRIRDKKARKAVVEKAADRLYEAAKSSDRELELAIQSLLFYIRRDISTDLLGGRGSLSIDILKRVVSKYLDFREFLLKHLNALRVLTRAEVREKQWASEPVDDGGFLMEHAVVVDNLRRLDGDMKEALELSKNREQGVDPEQLETFVRSVDEWRAQVDSLTELASPNSLEQWQIIDVLRRQEGNLKETLRLLQNRAVRRSRGEEQEIRERAVGKGSQVPTLASRRVRRLKMSGKPRRTVSLSWRTSSSTWPSRSLTSAISSRKGRTTWDTALNSDRKSSTNVATSRAENRSSSISNGSLSASPYLVNNYFSRKRMTNLQPLSFIRSEPVSLKLRRAPAPAEPEGRSRAEVGGEKAVMIPDELSEVASIESSFTSFFDQLAKEAIGKDISPAWKQFVKEVRGGFFTSAGPIQMLPLLIEGETIRSTEEVTKRLQKVVVGLKLASRLLDEFLQKDPGTFQLSPELRKEVDAFPGPSNLPHFLGESLENKELWKSVKELHSGEVEKIKLFLGELQQRIQALHDQISSRSEVRKMQKEVTSQTLMLNQELVTRNSKLSSSQMSFVRLGEGEVEALRDLNRKETRQFLLGLVSLVRSSGRVTVAVSTPEESRLVSRQIDRLFQETLRGVDRPIRNRIEVRNDISKQGYKPVFDAARIWDRVTVVTDEKEAEVLASQKRMTLTEGVRVIAAGETQKVYDPELIRASLVRKAEVLLLNAFEGSTGYLQPNGHPHIFMATREGLLAAHKIMDFVSRELLERSA